MSVNIPEAYANGSEDEQAFVANLALFFTGFFRSHIALLEGGPPEAQQALLLGLEYLLAISYVDNVEVFKARGGCAGDAPAALLPVLSFRRRVPDDCLGGRACLLTGVSVRW